MPHCPGCLRYSAISLQTRKTSSSISTLENDDMASFRQYEQLANTLPKPLLNFFRRFPPGSIAQTPPLTIEERIAPRAARQAAATEAAAAANPGQSSTESPTTPTSFSSSPSPTPSPWTSITPESQKALLSASPLADPNYNPFLPWRNPVTGRWRGAHYGLRRQADLCKMARKHGVEELLPWSPKLSWVKEEKKELKGLRVKGHLWERTMKGRLEERREAMRAMPELIQEWKRRGHGRGWKKWPK